MTENFSTRSKPSIGRRILIVIVLLPFALVAATWISLAGIAKWNEAHKSAEEQFAEATCPFGRGSFEEYRLAIENCIPEKFGPGADVTRWERYARGADFVLKDRASSAGFIVDSYVFVHDYEKGPDRWRIEVTHRDRQIEKITTAHFESHWGSTKTNIPEAFLRPGAVDDRFR